MPSLAEGGGQSKQSYMSVIEINRIGRDGSAGIEGASKQDEGIKAVGE